MKIRTLTAVIISLVVGVLIGLALHSPAKVRAYGGPHINEIKLAPEITPYGSGPLAGKDELGHIGSQVLGFSCIDVAGQPRCFVLNSD